MTVEWEDYTEAKRFANSGNRGETGFGLVTSFIDWLDARVGTNSELAEAFSIWDCGGTLDRDTVCALVKTYEFFAAAAPPPNGTEAADAYGTIARYMARPEFRDALRSQTGAMWAKAATVREFFARSLVSGAMPPVEVMTEAYALYQWATEVVPDQRRELAEKRDRLAQLQREIDALQKELDGE